MLVRLLSLVSTYLSGRFPDEEVVRAYDQYTSLEEMEQSAVNGKRRIYVLPPSQTGMDVPLDRGNDIERTVGVMVALLAKVSNFTVEECDPLLELSESIRKELWFANAFMLSTKGYSKASFVRLDDIASGGVGARTRLFRTVLIPRYKVTYSQRP